MAISKNMFTLVCFDIGLDWTGYQGTETALTLFHEGTFLGLVGRSFSFFPLLWDGVRPWNSENGEFIAIDL